MLMKWLVKYKYLTPSNVDETGSGSYRERTESLVVVADEPEEAIEKVREGHSFCEILDIHKLC